MYSSISSNIEREEINNVLNDIHELLKISKDIKRAVVIGGDVGGLKISESLFNLGLEVAIVEEGERILSRSFDQKASDIMSRRIEEVGLRLKCDVSVDEIIGGKDGSVRGVLFSDKSFLEAGLIVIDDNVLSNLDFTRKIGAEVRARLIVSHFTQGNEIGDMPGYPENILMNSFIFCGMPMASVGEFFVPDNNPGYDVHSFYDEIKQVYRKLVFKESRLAGYVLVGDIDLAGIFTSFIKFKCKLDAETKNKLCEGSPDILMWPEELFIKEWNP
nr:FAD-dependent oxidoreductase [Maridesulfovibrio ferrireducens]